MSQSLSLTGFCAEGPYQVETGFGIREDSRYPGAAFGVLGYAPEPTCRHHGLVGDPGQPAEGRSLAAVVLDPMSKLWVLTGLSCKARVSV